MAERLSANGGLKWAQAYGFRDMTCLRQVAQPFSSAPVERATTPMSLVRTCLKGPNQHQNQSFSTLSRDPTQSSLRGRVTKFSQRVFSLVDVGPYERFHSFAPASSCQPEGVLHDVRTVSSSEPIKLSFFWEKLNLLNSNRSNCQRLRAPDFTSIWKRFPRR